MNTDCTIEQKIKAEALRLGFSLCGISKAAEVPRSVSERMDSWIKDGSLAGMSYLDRNQEKRYDPRLLVEGAQSVISVALNYYTEDLQDRKLNVARFARIRDYHIEVKERLNVLLSFIKQLKPNVCGRCFTDSAPIMERYWAWKSGLGWIGRNHCLILPGIGSYVVLGELFINIDLKTDSPLVGSCLQCNKCITDCPTGALTAFSLDARKCLAYHTIESSTSVPEEYKEKMNGIIFGCDRCQEVCPHNADARASEVFKILDVFHKKDNTELYNLTEKEFNTIFRESTLRRAGYNKLRQNYLCSEKKKG